LTETQGPAVNYRRLLATLTSRARWLGSRDPESAAQETLRRSLEDARSQSSVEYYFSENIPPQTSSPEWRLDQFLAWLHGVLHFVVREEHNRANKRREVSTEGLLNSNGYGRLDPPDPAPDQLDALIQRELEEIIVECLPGIDSEYRTVLKMRAGGLKYSEIAVRLGVSENTVATWVSRGIRSLAQCVRRRHQRPLGMPRIVER
jgi:RNA polymerase sigma factor (sigma-70 family)